MPYIKTLLLIAILAVLVVGGVANTQAYTLSFLQWQLSRALPLWLLVLAAFGAGMIPIFIVGLPQKTADFTRMRALNLKRRQLEKQLKDLDREKTSLQT
ncbi:MAG: LapA family protein [Syntrophaceae bacterium]